MKDDFFSQKKIDLLKQECELHGLPFIGIEKHISSFYEYLHSIITRENHEKKIVNEGVIFKKTIPHTKKYRIIDYSLASSTDGSTSFFFVDGNGGDKTIVFDKPLSQIEFLKLVPESDNDSAIIIGLDYEVRIYYKGQISILRGRRWLQTPSMSFMEEQVKKADSGATWSALQEVLAFAYYELSVERIGATIVYFHNRKMYNGYFEKNKKKSIRFSNDDERHLLKNYLKYNDGAIVIDKDRKVIYTNIFLQIKDITRKKIGNYSGSRRTSAACFSYEVPTVYVITVSDDGPVHVFKEGKELESLASEKYSLVKNRNRKILLGYLKMAEERDSYPEYDEEEGKCPKCGKEFRVGIVRIVGFNDKEEYYCERCKTKLLSRSCFEILPI